MTEKEHREILIIVFACAVMVIIWVPLITWLLLRDSMGVTFIIPLTPPVPGIQALVLGLCLNLKPYEEMNCTEIMIHWKRVRYAHCLNLYESPNKVFWAIVDEAKSETLEIRDVNSGQVYHREIVKPDIASVVTIEASKREEAMP